MVRTFGGPAHQAARLEIMNTLIAAGADVNLQPRPNRQSLLIDLAAACGAVGSDVETMRFLVSKGANVHLVDNQNKTALDWARYFRCKPYITYLESLGAKVAGGWPAKNDAPAIQAVLTRNLASLGSIPLAELQRISGRTRLGVPVTALHIAIEEGDPNVLDVLMKRKADWNTGDSFGDTPLHLAVLLGKRDLVRRLMEAGADPNKEGQGRRTPFGLAAGTDPELALLMLDLGAQPRDPQVLADALWTGNLELVKRLWRLGGVTEEHIRDMAGMGYVALTEFLVQQVPLKLKTAEAWDAEAKRNQQAYDVLAAKAAILPAVVRETTAISAQRGNFNITLDSWAPWVTEPPEMDVKKAKLSLHVPPSYSGNDPVPLYIFVHGPRTQDAFPSRGYPEVLNKHHTIWASFSYDWVPNAHRVAYAITAVYHLRRQFNIDPKRIYIGGFSGGTADAARAILAYPGMFRAGVSATCMHPSYFYNQHLGYRYALNQILLTTDLGDWEGGWGVSSTCVPRSARKTYFMQSANHGHEIQSPENLDLALTFAEQ
jgi:ankyrin repeat protein